MVKERSQTFIATMDSDGHSINIIDGTPVIDRENSNLDYRHDSRNLHPFQASLAPWPLFYTNFDVLESAG